MESGRIGDMEKLIKEQAAALQAARLVVASVMIGGGHIGAEKLERARDAYRKIDIVNTRYVRFIDGNAFY